MSTKPMAMDPETALALQSGASRDRDPLKHLLIGSPAAIRATIHRLHNLGYAEAGLWSPLIAIPNHQLIVTPNPGDEMSLLMRYVRLE